MPMWAGAAARQAVSSMGIQLWPKSSPGRVYAYVGRRCSSPGSFQYGDSVVAEVKSR